MTPIEKTPHKVASWKRPFLYLSGTDQRIIAQCSPHLATLYSILGGVVCIPALIGFFSSSYAVSILLPDLASPWYIGLIWALVILIIDRSIVAYNPEIEDDPVIVGAANVSDGAKGRRRSLYWARVIISIILGLVIAEPMCIRIFQDEIQQQLALNRRTDFEEQRKKNDTLINKSNERVEKRREEWKDAKKDAKDEYDGKAPSKIAGPGHRFIYKEKVADSLKRDLNRYELIEKDYRDSIGRKTDTLEAHINRYQAVSLTGQMHALNQVSAKSLDLMISVWALRFLFLFIELIPLVLKGSLKKRSDAYVIICHQNNKRTIELNKEDKNNIAVRQMLQASMEEDLRINRALHKNSMDAIAEDLQYYMRLNEELTEEFERKKGVIEQKITNQEIRGEMLAAMTESYRKFIAQLKQVYNKESAKDD